MTQDSHAWVGDGAFSQDTIGRGEGLNTYNTHERRTLIAGCTIPPSFDMCRHDGTTS
jgi:hypothetical protein